MRIAHHQTMPDIKISAVICTYNRAEYLSRAIESLAHQDLDSAGYEIIVVDNNSTDNTAQLVKNSIEAYPSIQIRYVLETEPGLSAGRNRGAHEAAGNYIAYVDDDARAVQGWLSSLLASFLKLQAACIGGPVNLDWEGDPPKWFPFRYLSLFTYLDYGPEVLLLNEQAKNRYLQGANMAFRRDLIVNDGFMFSTNIGRKKNDLLSGEETEVIDRLLEAGQPVYYLPDALVWHLVLPSRRSRQYLFIRLVANGATQPLMELNKGTMVRNQLARHLLYDVRNGCLCLARMVVYSLLLRREKAEKNLYEGLRYYGRAKTE